MLTHTQNAFDAFGTKYKIRNLTFRRSVHELHRRPRGANVPPHGFLRRNGALDALHRIWRKQLRSLCGVLDRDGWQLRRPPVVFGVIYNHRAAGPPSCDARRSAQVLDGAHGIIRPCVQFCQCFSEVLWVHECVWRILVPHLPPHGRTWRRGYEE